MAIAFVSAQSGVFTTGGTSTTFSSGTLTAATAGAAVCIFAAGSNATPGSWTLTDNVSGNTYTNACSANDVAGGFSAAAFYGLNIQNGPTVYTVHFGGTSSFNAILVNVFTGVATSSAIDGTPAARVQALPGTGTNAISGGNFTPLTAGDLIWGATVDEGSTGTTVHGTGFTLGTTDSVSYWSEYNLSGSTGAQAAGFTDATNGGADNYISAGFALKAAVAAAPYIPPRPKFVTLTRYTVSRR